MLIKFYGYLLNFMKFKDIFETRSYAFIQSTCFPSRESITKNESVV